MALISNSAFYRGLGPARGYAATQANGAQRESMALTGARRNYFAGEHAVSGQTSKGAVPSGALHPVAWLAPQKAGGLSSRFEVPAVFTVPVASGAMGVNGEASAPITFTVGDAQLLLVVNGSGSIDFAFTTSDAELAGALSAEGATSIVFSGSLAPPDLRNLEGTTAIVFNVADLSLEASWFMQGLTSAALAASATARAEGAMAGSITPFTELSPQSLASAVWAALAAENNLTGSMGRLLNSSGGGSDPDTIAAAVWAAVTRTLTGEVSANVTKVNNVAVEGTGTELDPWGPV